MQDFIENVDYIKKIVEDKTQGVKKLLILSFTEKLSFKNCILEKVLKLFVHSTNRLFVSCVSPF